MYSSIPTNVDHPASWIDLARLLRPRATTFSVSTSIIALKPDLVIANVENSAAGFGVTGDIAETILKYGVDVMTSGNHIWDKKEAIEYIDSHAKGKK